MRFHSLAVLVPTLELQERSNVEIAGLQVEPVLQFFQLGEEFEVLGLELGPRALGVLQRVSQSSILVLQRRDGALGLGQQRQSLVRRGGAGGEGEIMWGGGEKGGRIKKERLDRGRGKNKDKILCLLGNLLPKELKERGLWRWLWIWPKWRPCHCPLGVVEGCVVEGGAGGGVGAGVAPTRVHVTTDARSKNIRRIPLPFPAPPATQTTFHFSNCGTGIIFMTTND